MNLPEATIQAIRDYAFLLRKGYPDKRTLELVADRHHLDHSGRAVLYRGVFKEAINAKRKGKLLLGVPDDHALLRVDALNQVYSIASYLAGQLVFIATDGYLRDASGFHGEILPGAILQQSIDRLHAFFDARPGLRVELLLDTQADAFSSVRDAFHEHLGPVRLIGSDSVDAMLSSGRGYLVATSDSTIIDRTPNPVFDLARFILEQNYSGKIPDIAEILSRID